MSDQHSSTVEESAPLLPGHDEEEQSFFAQFSALTKEPLTLLTKVLLGVVLVLLLLTSMFIGLFAGVEHRLSSRGPGVPADGGNATLTVTATSTTTEYSISTTALPPHPTSGPRERLCFTPQCITLSASILNSLDPSQDPCENFYDFTTGGWLKSHPLPTDKEYFGVIQQVAISNRETIRQILATNSSPYSSADAQTLAKLRDFYQSCLDEDQLNNVGDRPLKDIIRTIGRLYNRSSTVVGSQSPIQHPFNVMPQSGLTAAVAYLHSLGVEAFFSFDIGGDVGLDPDRMTLWFNQPGLGLPSEDYYDEESPRALYISVITRIFSALEANGLREDVPFSTRQRRFWPPSPWPPWGGDEPGPEKKTPKELAEAVVQLEREIARAELALDKLEQDPVGTYNPLSFSNFTSSVPEFDFPAYWSTFAARTIPERIIVKSPSYLSSLSRLLSNTSSDVLEGYLIARASLSLANHLGMDTNIWKANRALTEELEGIKKGAVSDRAEYCTEMVDKAFGLATGRFFVLENFGEKSKAKGTRVIQDIIETFKKSVKNLDWMDKISAKEAAEKASAMRIKVGFPLSPNTTDPQAIARYYSRVKIDNSDFFGNMLRASVLKETLKWSKLGKKRDKESWEMNPSAVNAYFNAPANEIVFPAGIMQPPLFFETWPNYLLYGAFGDAAAHELTHAFDSAGRLYDEKGRLRKWWTNSTSNEFEKRRHCISRQYSNFTVDDGKGGHIHVNGNLTSGENIGDAGLIQAYRAWKAQYNSSLDAGSEYLLPGLNYTRDQLFFISFGRFWAENISPQAAVERVRTNSHTLNKFRVEGTLFNMDSSTFAAAFNCPIGSKLNPSDEQKCKLW